MGIFSRKPTAPRAMVPNTVLNQLSSFGQASLDARAQGAPLLDPRFQWDNFFSSVMLAMQGNQAQVIQEIHAAASDDPMAMFGGYRLVAEFDGGLQDPLYLEMMDAGLALMRARGLSRAHLTGYESARWHS